MICHVVGENHLICEFAADMSLDTNLRAIRIGRALQGRHIDGLLECYPTNTSLMIRFDTALWSPEDLSQIITEIADEIDGPSSPTLITRAIQLPTWYDDPVTRACQERFATSRHDPAIDDLTFCAQANGLTGKPEMIERFSGAPWVVSAAGFYPGSMESVQLVAEEDQLTTPKYLSPRLTTPVGTVGQAGCFGGIYPYESAGGYQMLGRTPTPIYEPEATLADFVEGPTLFRAGDVLVFNPIDQREFDAIETKVADRTFTHNIIDVELPVDEVLNSPAAASRRVFEALGL